MRAPRPTVQQCSAVPQRVEHDTSSVTEMVGNAIPQPFRSCPREPVRSTTSLLTAKPVNSSSRGFRLEGALVLTSKFSSVKAFSLIERVSYAMHSLLVNNPRPQDKAPRVHPRQQLHVGLANGRSFFGL